MKAVNLFAGEKMSEAGEASACSVGESMGACGGGNPTTIADLLDGVITLSGVSTRSTRQLTLVLPDPDS